MSSPSPTSQRPARQPHAVGTFSLTGPGTVALSLGNPHLRRSRRLAGQPVHYQTADPTQYRQASGAVSSQQNIHSPPATAGFTFTAEALHFPRSGFTSISTPITGSISAQVPPSLSLLPIHLPGTADMDANNVIETLASGVSTSSARFNPPEQVQLPSSPRGQPSQEDNQCIICCGQTTSLLQPCLQCEAFYCVDCIKGMFQGAIYDVTRMPARCCTILQLPVALPYLTQEQTDAYRAKFEEWMAPQRTYCPKPTCSAFIPERFHLPQPKTPPTMWEIIHRRLRDVVQTLMKSPHSRYFRVPSSPIAHGVTDWHKVIRKHIYLDFIESRVSSYTSLNAFMTDMNLLFSNASIFHNTKFHAVGVAGDRLRDLLFHVLSNLRIDFGPSVPAPTNACFACPQCFTAICQLCKQMAHPSRLCDTTVQDQEAALLETWGYKQCPRCRHAVKKLYGCRHIRCICGAHWCYYCRDPIDQCDRNGCDAADNSEYGDEGEQAIYDDEGDGPAHGEADRGRFADREAIAFGPAGIAIEPQQELNTMDRLASDGVVVDGGALPGRSETPQQGFVASPFAMADRTAMHTAPLLDLDAGGAGVWEGNGNFGDEPEEPHGADVAWICTHDFNVHRINSSRINNGYPSELECNRCFSKVYAEKIADRKSGNRYNSNSGHILDVDFCTKSDSSTKTKTEGRGAWECDVCGLVVCKACQSYYSGAK